MLLIVQIIALTIFPQSTKILFVEAYPPTGNEDVGRNINKSIKEELKKQIPEYWSEEKSYAEWRFVQNKAAYLRDNGITYVLQIRPFNKIRSIDNKVEIGFDFYFVDSVFNLNPEIWDNSDYILKLKNEVPRNSAMLATTVKDEIQFYLDSGSDDMERKFRPRIKINDFSIPTNGIEYIDMYDFRDWLRKKLESISAANPVCIFYDPNTDKLYPEESEHIISGEFSQYKVNNDNLVRIAITINLPDETKRFVSEINIEKNYNPVNNVDIVQEIVNALVEKYH